MRVTTTILSICMALLIPMAAVAKQPEPAGCEILFVETIVPESLYEPVSVAEGVPFTVKVMKSPGYPGEWFKPSVSIEINVPLDEPMSANPLTPETYSQIVTQTFDRKGPNAAYATFIIPFWLLKPDYDGLVNISATVSQQINRGKHIETYCDADVMLM